MISIQEQHIVLQELFVEYASNAYSKAKLSLALNYSIDQLERLQATFDPELLDITRGSMIDLYDKKFSIRYFFYPAQKLINEAKSTFLLRLLNLNNN